ncbi:coxsackievirus and adenovirus receptor [Solea senegalensis]|uniref:Coxsackievirus and adenovirus receptor n=1 Tax=Solea senegalensis TaxID=28829 RepID=A0AAV6QQ73_SOLSE|nr:coxsackievirus and adenovirus receptor [Solea senegalensis]
MFREASPKSHRRIPWFWPIFIVSTILTSTCGLNITSSLSRYYVARGDSVSLKCEFNLAPEDLCHLEIEWFLKSADIREEDKPLIWYVNDRIHNRYYGCHFSSLDPQDGDASLTLKDVKLTDTGTYQCKVKKAPGNKSKIMQVMVMEKISKPECGISGDVKLGNKLRVNCSVLQGDRPIQFHWKKITGDRLFPENRTHFDSIQGDLYINDLQATDSGTYRCTAANCDDCMNVVLKSWIQLEVLSSEVVLVFLKRNSVDSTSVTAAKMSV